MFSGGARLYRLREETRTLGYRHFRIVGTSPVSLTGSVPSGGVGRGGAAVFSWCLPVDTTEGVGGTADDLSVYATLEIFLLLASRNRSANRSLIAFTAWSSIAQPPSWRWGDCVM